MSDYWDHHSSWSRNGVPLREEGYVTDLLAAEAEHVVRRHAAVENRSLFLWLSLSAPHTPLQAPSKWLRLQPKALDPLLRVYSAMGERLPLDAQVLSENEACWGTRPADDFVARLCATSRRS